jgi:accessory colonization factor AcfC
MCAVDGFLNLSASADPGEWLCWSAAAQRPPDHAALVETEQDGTIFRNFWLSGFSAKHRNPRAGCEGRRQ